jgi:hypothetical protein
VFRDLAFAKSSHVPPVDDLATIRGLISVYVSMAAVYGKICGRGGEIRMSIRGSLNSGAKMVVISKSLVGELVRLSKIFADNG